MLGIVRTLETTIALPGYRSRVLSQAMRSAQINPGPVGAFMGYDFHLGEEGPRLIEVNTNAGGAFLNAVLVRAQRHPASTRSIGLRCGGDRPVQERMALPA